MEDARYNRGGGNTSAFRTPFVAWYELMADLFEVAVKLESQSLSHLILHG